MKVNVFERLLPERMRKRKPMRDEELQQRLAELQDTDPSLRCLTEIAARQFEQNMMESFDVQTDDAKRLRAVERAGTLSYLLKAFDDEREAARAERKRKETEQTAG